MSIHTLLGHSQVCSGARVACPGPHTAPMDPATLATSCFAGAHHGLRSTAELRQRGVEKEALARLLRSNVLTRVTAGYFALADPPVEPLVAQVRRARALEMRYGHRVMASHHLAVAMWGLPLRSVPTDLVHLTYRRGGRYRRRSDHIVHVAPSGVEVASGPIPLVKALIQCGSTWGEDAFVVPADQALRRGLVSEPDLLAVIDSRAEAPRHPLLVRAVSRLDGKSESPGESLLRLRMLDLGYPVTSQVWASVSGRRYRIDLVIEGTRVAVEFDGMVKYADPEEAAAAKRAEKVREELLRSDHWVVVRFQWAELFDIDEIHRRILWALEQDRRQRAA